MRSRLFVSLFVALFVVALAGQVVADDKPCCSTKEKSSCTTDKACGGCGDKAVKTTDANQTKCPIMGGDVNKTVFADYAGKRVYFCCAPCTDAFKKDPDKYIEKMEKDGVTLEVAPKMENQKKKT